MILFENILKRFGYIKANKKRNFDAAGTGRLVADWVYAIGSADKEIHASLDRMRGRSRELAMNNTWYRRYIHLTKTHVVGPKGVQLQLKAQDPNGALDTVANDRIESHWNTWGKRGTCDTTGRLSWVGLQHLAIESCARDGEVLIRFTFDSKSTYGLKLQVIEADLLDHKLNIDLKNGNTVRMGVELNQWGMPVAYHLLNKHPNDGDFTSTQTSVYQRVSADEILHLYLPDRAHQNRGYPWGHAAMAPLNMVRGYEEAEVVAARTAAAKMGFFTQNEAGDAYQGEVEDSGRLVMNAEPGTFEMLPFGVNVQTFDPQHPSGNFASFMKTALRSIASGLNVSYNTLANDLEGVNFSSMRAGLLEERSNYEILQNWFIEWLCQPVFEKWLEIALLKNVLGLPANKFDKFNAASWQPRRWAWVDPMKDVEANILAIGHGLKSPYSVASESGVDPEDILREIARFKAAADKQNVPEVMQSYFDPQNGAPTNEVKNPVP